MNKKILSYCLFVIVLCLAVYLRVYRLGGMYSYNYDEGVYAESGKMVALGYLPFNDFFSGQPPHFSILIGVFFRLLGINIFSARLFIVLTSLLCIMSVYFIAKEAGSQAVLPSDNCAGLLSAFFLSISPLFVNQSRIVQSEVPSIAFVLLGVLLFLRARRYNNPLYYFISGIFISLGIMMKLNVGIALVLIIGCFITSKGVRGAIFFIAGCIIPLLILPIFNFNKMIDQMIIYHLSKPAIYKFSDRILWIWETLNSDIGLFISFIAGVVLCIMKKRFDGIFIVILSCAFFLFCLFYRALFPHHTTILIPLMSILSGIGISYLFTIPRVKIRRGILFIIFLSYGIYSMWLIKKDIDFISQNDNPYYVDVVKVISSRVNENEYILTDEQIISFFANKRLPSDFVDTSNYRIITKYLSSEMLIDACKQYNVKMVIISSSRFVKLKEFIKYVRTNYELIKEYKKGRFVYIKKSESNNL
ncbi:MAG: glycosyltransferase family 39 protein [Candidatus Hydrogenedentota bacterium]